MSQDMTWAEILAVYPWLQPIIDTLKPVIGDVYGLLISGIRSKQKARDLLTLTDAMVKVQEAAPHASIAYEAVNGRSKCRNNRLPT